MSAKLSGFTGGTSLELKSHNVSVRLFLWQTFQTKISDWSEEESYCQIKHTIWSGGYWLLSPLQKNTDPCPFVSRPAFFSYPANITFSRLSLDKVEALRLSDKSRVTAAQKEAFFPHLHLAAAPAEELKKRGDEFNPPKILIFTRWLHLHQTETNRQEVGSISLDSKALFKWQICKNWNQF